MKQIHKYDMRPLDTCIEPFFNNIITVKESISIYSKITVKRKSATKEATIETSDALAKKWLRSPFNNIQRSIIDDIAKKMNK